MPPDDQPLLPEYPLPADGHPLPPDDQPLLPEYPLPADGHPPPPDDHPSLPLSKIIFRIIILTIQLTKAILKKKFERTSFLSIRFIIHLPAKEPGRGIA